MGPCAFFLRIMSVNDDRTAEMIREEKEPEEEEEVVRAEAIGGGGGTTEDADGVAGVAGNRSVLLRVLMFVVYRRFVGMKGWECSSRHIYKSAGSSSRANSHWL